MTGGEYFTNISNEYQEKVFEIMMDFGKVCKFDRICFELRINLGENLFMITGIVPHHLLGVEFIYSTKGIMGMYSAKNALFFHYPISMHILNLAIVYILKKRIK